jgi:membrane-associated protease RseP (regulator of RpoE activity)
MLNETASRRDARPVQPSSDPDLLPDEPLQDQLLRLVTEVLDVQQVRFEDMDADTHQLPTALRAFGGPALARFAGQLRLPSEAAYDQLDNALRLLGLTPVFRQERDQHVILILRGRILPKPRPWWPNLLLFVLTLLSVLLVGTELALMEIAQNSPFQAMQIANNLGANLWRGLPYAISIMLILGGHELGHYFAARRHGLAVSLPYFIPLPFFSPFGTLGAFIQLREPMRNRKILLDVGASGPLVGLVFAIPLLFIGLASARVGPVTPGGIYEGDSLLYAFAKIVTFGQFLPADGFDVYINSSQLAWAGWTGLLVSALNLVPIGQLDGGHIVYALLGDRARWLYYPLILIMGVLVLITNVWLIWVLLLLLFGRVYATPLDMITPLDRPRQLVGVLAMVIFLLIFVPTPLSPSRDTPPVNRPGSSVEFAPPQSLAWLLSGQ